jgi:hypothetical protein
MARPDRTVNGCFDHPPFAPTLTAQDGWLDEGRVRRLVTIPAANTRDCQYSKTTVDAKCFGCKWNQQGGQDAGN